MVYIQQEDQVGLCFLFGKNVQKTSMDGYFDDKKVRIEVVKF
jgi:hypothetical protein